MRFLAGCLAAAAFLHATGQVPKPRSKAPTPTAVFMLQPATKLASNSSLFKMVALSPLPVIQEAADDGSLLALLPEQDGRWELQRLTAWQTATPQVRRLFFAGEELRDDRDLLQPELLPSPDGKTLAVRISILALNTEEWTRRAVIVMIDLSSMEVLWRTVTEDPLLADSRWAFADAHTLIATEATGPVKHRKFHVAEVVPEDVLGRNPVVAGRHRAEALSFPDLRPISTCEYSVKASAMQAEQRSDAETAISDEDDDSADIDDGEEDVPVAPDPGPPKPPNKIVLVGDTCAPFFRAAKVSAAEDLPGLREVRGHVGRSGWPGCDFDEESQRSGLAVFNCRVGHMTEKSGFYTQSEELRVMPLSLGRNVLSLPLRPNERYSDTLVSVAGRNYLVVLRDKLRVEAYAFP